MLIHSTIRERSKHTNWIAPINVRLKIICWGYPMDFWNPIDIQSNELAIQSKSIVSSVLLRTLCKHQMHICNQQFFFVRQFLFLYCQCACFIQFTATWWLVWKQLRNGCWLQQHVYYMILLKNIERCDFRQENWIDTCCSFQL